MEDVSCDQCKFWVKRTDGSPLGECHRIPPSFGQTYEKDANIVFGIFLSTMDEGWCGEFVPRASKSRFAPNVTR